MLLPDDIQICEQNLTCDPGHIRELNRRAFGTDGGTAKFDQLRRKAGRHLSLVARRESELLGHVFFAPVEIAGQGSRLPAMGLGELAVHPDWQRCGIGRALATRGLERLQAAGCSCVIVIGLPDYYPKLGFEPGSNYRLECQWPGVPAASFMVYVMNAAALQGVSGVARYLDL